jgi:hypothetical protein
MPTTTVASFDVALVPAAFRARTRIKYVPFGTSLAVRIVARPPVAKLATLAEPGAEPTSMT